MALTLDGGRLLRPASGRNYEGKSRLRSIGIGFAIAGLVLALVGLASSAVLGLKASAGVSESFIDAQDALTFGLATAALVVVKIGIGLTLWGIGRRVWTRIESMKFALQRLVPTPTPPSPPGRPPKGTRITPEPPKPLLIHRMAFVLWLPMLAMGAMIVAAGLGISVFASQAITSGDTDNARVLRTLEPGVLFLGEGFLLSGVSFLLGSILGSLRRGGAEVQHGLGVPIQTPRMPLGAKLFVGAMMVGLMIEMAQFALYAYATRITDSTQLALWTAWLGPLRETGLLVLLVGIVLALATIAEVLNFQSNRVKQLIPSAQGAWS